MGYTLLSKKRYSAAIAIFSHNTRLFPQSSNAYDSLGEAYLRSGDKANALRYYQQAVALDPLNKTASENLNQLLP